MKGTSSVMLLLVGAQLNFKICHRETQTSNQLLFFVVLLLWDVKKIFYIAHKSQQVKWMVVLLAFLLHIFFLNQWSLLFGFLDYVHIFNSKSATFSRIVSKLKGKFEFLHIVTIVYPSVQVHRDRAHQQWWRIVATKRLWS